MMKSEELPVLSCAEAAATEAKYIAGDSEIAWRLMQSAAQGVADESCRLLGSSPKRILVLAGKGNNGADAYLAALHGARKGTEIIAVFPEGGPCNPIAQRAWASRKNGVQIVLIDPASLDRVIDKKFCLIFDGLLGQGFRPPLSPRLGAFLDATDALSGLRVAVDLPSGLGDASAGKAFRADLTVSIGCLKRPLLAPQNRRFVGRLRVVDIGLPWGDWEESCVTEEVLVPLRRLRRVDCDKRQQGQVLIVGGSEAMPGAVLMNTQAALCSGAALVTVCLPESVRSKAAIAYPEAMWQGLRTTPKGQVALSNVKQITALLGGRDVLLIGSGMGEKAEKVIVAIAERCDTAIVLDADALRPAVVSAAMKAPVRVLLPHAGEFLRLYGRKATFSAAREYARANESIVVLKGVLTCITDGRRVVYVPFGGPVLARGGSGDLLAGIVASVLARRHELKVSPFRAVEMAVTWHALAADWLRCFHGEEAVRTTDLLSGLSPALRV